MFNSTSFRSGGLCERVKQRIEMCEDFPVEHDQARYASALQGRQVFALLCGQQAFEERVQRNAQDGGDGVER